MRGHDVGDARVLVVRGDIDVAAVPAFAERLDSEIAEGHHRLVVDLTAVEFLRSPAITALLHARQAVRARGGTLAVVAAGELLQTTFAVTGLEDELGVTGTREDALRRVASSSVSSR